jgi:hypothetical protein
MKDIDLALFLACLALAGQARNDHPVFAGMWLMCCGLLVGKQSLRRWLDRRERQQLEDEMRESGAVG